MAVTVEERYRQIFEEHRFASEYRLKILAAWGASYAALAAVFVWAQSAIRPLSWTVTLLGIAVTVLLWIGDLRNRPAIRRSKEVGAAIEAAHQIPETEQFFAKLKKGISHSTAINAFAIIMLLLLGAATAYLFCNRGELPR